MFYCDLNNKMNVFWMHFSHFKLCQTAIFGPVDLRTVYTHLLKALKEENLTQYMKMRVEGRVKKYGRPSSQTDLRNYTETIVPKIVLILIQKFK